MNLNSTLLVPKKCSIQHTLTKYMSQKPTNYINKIHVPNLQFKELHITKFTFSTHDLLWVVIYALWWMCLVLGLEEAEWELVEVVWMFEKPM